MSKEHFPSSCPFCSKAMTYHIVDGKKVIDKPCDCAQSKEYSSEPERKKRAEAERKERVRLKLEEPRPGDVVDGKVVEKKVEAQS